jgi:hypothetical protein
MSAPALAFQSADFLSYGFIADRAEKAAARLREGAALTGSDREAITNGVDFLKRVSVGTSYLEGLQTHDDHLMDALDAVDVAIDPIKILAGQMESNAEIGRYLATVAETVQKYAENPTVERQAQELKNIELFGLFFGALYKTALHLLAGDAPVVGDPGRLRPKENKLE